MPLHPPNHTLTPPPHTPSPLPSPRQALHGDMSQREREKVLERFREGKTTVMVATDVAARGLDISDVDLVVHYELPQDPEAFLHRSGGYRWWGPCLQVEATRPAILHRQRHGDAGKLVEGAEAPQGYGHAAQCGRVGRCTGT